MPRRAPGPPFWVPGGSWTSLLGFFGSNVAPQRPPGRLLEDFGAHLGGHFEPKINEIWCWISMCFRDDFWRGFGVVLVLFLWLFRSPKDPRIGKGYFSEMLVLHKEFNCFQRLWAPFWVPKMIKSSTGIRSRFQFGFWRFKDHFWDPFWSTNHLKIKPDFLSFSGR
jgi:hypothetical protein